MWIGGTPNIKIRKSGFKHSTQPLPFPLNGNCLLFFSARYALFQGLSALRLKAGDRLLVPAYCCGTEVDPILAKGIKIEWYNVDEDFRIDVKDLGERWQKDVKGLLITHYLGFNQLTDEILDFCHDRKISLIEDCAHAFLSLNQDGEPLGSKGDAAIFSLRKSMPIPDGGVLFMKTFDLKAFHSQLKQPDPIAVFFRASELMELNTTLSNSFKERFISYSCRVFGKVFLDFRLFFRVSHKLLGVWDKCLLDPNSYNFVSEATCWTMSSFSKRRLQSQDWEGVIKKRRSNFKYLLQRIKEVRGIRPLFVTLPAGTCPLFFPIRANDREALHNSLVKKGVDSHPWWGYFHPAVPYDLFPVAVRLKKQIIGFPIHQDLTENHLDGIIYAVKSVIQDR
jgi:perosamine synthetase